MSTDATLTRTRLVGGLWEGIVSVRNGLPPRLRLRHDNTVLSEAETMPGADGAGKFLVRFRIPSEVLSDGVQTLVIEDAETGDAVAHETIISGEVADDDVRAEVALLRAELDMLKRAFRRHCAEHPI